MGNRTWILQIMFFSVVPYSVLISLRNSDVLAITERSLINIEKEDLNGIAKTNDNKITSAKITDNNKTIVVKDIERKSITLIKNGIFWSDYAESCVPKGSSKNDSFMLIKKLRSQKINTLKEGTTYMCGTSKGGIVTLQDGTIMCAKYKRKQRSVYAEVLSYYLSRLLNMDNIPEVFLARIDPSSPRWKDVDPRKLSWDEDEIIALVTWQKNCKLKTLMPATIREAYFRQETITSKLINSSWTLQNNPGMLSELIQWGTILIFDDLIGHFDRLVRMQPYGDENRYDVHADSLHNSVKSSN
ncbi:four-jointed box protein 1-like, partial [Ruditapes philippinarum]|uniref:four-jointed box protein 1-like n=1 Tax=Ruditapes philippinarum TaxID=129788 RepID=UPI00295C1FB7